MKDVRETDDREGGRPRRRKTKTDVPETEGVCFLKIVEGLSGCHCLISVEWRVWVQRCMSLIDDSGGVSGCGWVVGGCAWVRVVMEEMTERARFVA